MKYALVAPFFTLASALVLPSAPHARAPRAATVRMAEPSSPVAALRLALELVQGAAPLASEERAEVCSLCAQISTSASVAPAAAAGSAPVAAPPPEAMGKAAVEGALTNLFGYYDADSDGYFTIDEMVRADDAVRSTYDSSMSGSAWGARQARAGMRRMRRLFAKSDSDDDGRVSLGSFVGTLLGEYEKRLERGLSVATAVAEIESHMPQAEMYGYE